MRMAMRLRPATEADFPELTRIRSEGIGSYASFMPEGWQPPDENEHKDRVEARMLDPDHWVTVAEDDDGQILGYVAAGPAMEGWFEGPRIPGAAYLWMLFIDSKAHRRGVGRELQKSAFDEMRSRGYERALVRMAADAEQARGFYAATGWRVIDEFEDELLGMPTLVGEHDV
jgi:ribosomal protein S18 acetylase RimI-like enzyme